MHPLRCRKLSRVQHNIPLSVQFTEITKKKVLVKSPRLALIIVDILHLKTDFLLHFPHDRLLRRLPDLRKSSDERVPFVLPVGVGCHQNILSVRHPDNHRRCDLWEHLVAACGTE